MVQQRPFAAQQSVGHGVEGGTGDVLGGWRTLAAEQLQPSLLNWLLQLAEDR